jgi:S1-C subfamily serine protease
MSRRIAAAVSALALIAAGIAMSPAAGAQDDKVKRLVDRRVEVIRPGGGKLGVRLEDVDRDDVTRLKLPAERGAIVKSVSADTPAQKAGLQEGDVILRYEDETVQSAAQLSRLVRETPAGRTVTLEVSRGGVAQKLSATLAEGRDRVRVGDFDIEIPFAAEPAMPPMPPVPEVPPVADMFHFDGKGRSFRFFGDRGPRKLGIEYQELTDQLARYFKVDKGVLVTSVDEEGPAGKGGLRAGDVIVKFDGEPIDDADDLRDQVRKAEGGKDVSITVQRDGRPLDLSVKLAAPESRARGGETT